MPIMLRLELCKINILQYKAEICAIFLAFKIEHISPFTTKDLQRFQPTTHMIHADMISVLFCPYNHLRGIIVKQAG